MTQDPRAGLSPTAQALLSLARVGDAGVEEVLAALPLLPEASGQEALDECLDAVMDCLRMLSARARESAHTLPVAVPASPAPGPPGLAAPARREAVGRAAGAGGAAGPQQWRRETDPYAGPAGPR